MSSLARASVLLSAIMLCFAPLCRGAEAQDAAALVAGAERAVERYVGDLLAEMRELQPLYESDREAYFAAVEQALSEFVDFREVARGVMARYSVGPDGATEAQLQRFAEVFRDSLVDFYGSALAGYDGVEYEIVPPPSLPADPANGTNVHMNILADDGSRFEVQYAMYLNEDQVWKLRNLYVEGVNLRRQYHAQFDSLMASHDYDIDKVIDAWEVAE